MKMRLPSFSLESAGSKEFSEVCEYDAGVRQLNKSIRYSKEPNKPLCAPTLCHCALDVNYVCVCVSGGKVCWEEPGKE